MPARGNLPFSQVKEGRHAAQGDDLFNPHLRPLRCSERAVSGARTVPVIVIGSAVMVGFHRAQIDTLLEADA